MAKLPATTTMAAALTVAFLVASSWGIWALVGGGGTWFWGLGFGDVPWLLSSPVIIASVLLAIHRERWRGHMELPGSSPGGQAALAPGRSSPFQVIPGPAVKKSEVCFLGVLLAFVLIGLAGAALVLCFYLAGSGLGA